MISQTFIDTFGLVEDPIYAPMLKVVEVLDTGTQYTTAQIFSRLEAKYRRITDTQSTWNARANKAMDQLEQYDLIAYHDGYYHKTGKR